MEKDSVDFTLTDIPYGEVNRSSNGLRELDKGNVDIMTFEMEDFLDNVYKVSKNSICIFCGLGQFSEIYNYFKDKKGTVRPIIWEKTNPSPMNGQYVYLSGVEIGVWFKKRGAKTFNAHCKNTVFRFPNGKSNIISTEKNDKLLNDLILDNTNKGDIVYDPCMGGGSHGEAALKQSRRFIGNELREENYKLCEKRLSKYRYDIINK